MSAPSWTHRAYRLLMRCLSPLALTWLWWRGRKDPGYREHLPQRLGQIEPNPASIRGLLIHAASVGEVQAAQSLIKALRAHWPDHTITVTTQTPTGKRTLHSHWGDALQHLYFPVDTPAATARFLDRLQPALVILIEREIWPEWMLQCRARAIPVALVNARLSEKSASNYQRLHRLVDPIWRDLALVASGDEASATRLRALGVPADRCLTTGNLKFDQQPPPGRPGLAQVPTLQRPLVVAGSTHEGEERALLDAWPGVVAEHPDALLVLVPRHPERFDDVAAQIQARGWPLARRSRGDVPDSHTTVWLGDTMGELGAWYAQARLCFIGGTLVPIGGHNPLEAMAMGKAVIFGQHTHNAADVYKAIGLTSGGRRVHTGSEAMAVASEWLKDPEALAKRGEVARTFVLAQRGSSEMTLQALNAVWRPLLPALLGPVIETKVGSTTLWHAPEQLGPAFNNTAFEPPSTGSTALATGSGRGQAQRLNLQGHDVVLRHYRRGGWVARFNPDRYRLSRVSDSRAMREFALLRWMAARGLPVPVPLAARQQVTGRHYTADIIVAMIPDTQNLVQRLQKAPISIGEWHAVGAAIRQLHEAQVFHSDLNAHNLLLNETGQAWIVDFDKCEKRSGEQWKSLNLARLLRSLRKEALRVSPFHWQESDWTALTAGYHSNPRPA